MEELPVILDRVIIADQVCSFAQAKKLNELGFNKNSIFSFAEGFYNDVRVCLDFRRIQVGDVALFEQTLTDGVESICFRDLLTRIGSRMKNTYSAYTVSELKVFLDDFYEHFPRYSKSKSNSYWVWGHNVEIKGKLERLGGVCRSEAEALADMLICYIEHGLIKTKKKRKLLSALF